MKKMITFWNLFSILALLALVAIAFGVVFPVQAQVGTPAPPTLPAGSLGGSVGATVVVPADVTPVVPDTGAPAAGGGLLFSGWTFLVIMALVIIMLLVALLARSSYTPPPE